MTIDRRSVAGKKLDIAGHCQLLVVGAGPAGLAAARRAAEGGAGVVLVDENPVAFETMGESVPQLWGSLMGGEVRNRNAMLERVLEARPDIADLFEMGVDVRLSTACWGLFVNHQNLNWMPGPVAGLVDAEQGSHLLGFDHAIVATGRRDMGLAFPGWDLPGVGGLCAAIMLARLYGAFAAKRAVVLGTTPETLIGVLDLCDAGIEIAAVVEQGEIPVADPALVRQVEAKGIPILTDQKVQSAVAGDDRIRAIRFAEREIACDSILLGIGAVPMVDLLQAAGARTIFDAGRGGFVPALGTRGQTSLVNVRAVGDCAGIWAAKSADLTVAVDEGRRAAEAALADLGQPLSGEIPNEAPEAPAGFDIGAYRKAWVEAGLSGMLDDVFVCQCEEVTAREILEVRPPRYLNAPPRSNEARSLTEILGEGPPNPDQVKRLTRAGMGACQGRRCREQVQALLALRENLDLAGVPLAAYRSPVRPLSLAAMSPAAEDPEITEQWDVWFGMPRQWVPYWEVEKRYTVASLSTETDHVVE